MGAGAVRTTCGTIVADIKIIWDRDIAQPVRDALKVVRDDVSDVGGKIKCAASLEPTESRGLLHPVHWWHTRP